MSYISITYTKIVICNTAITFSNTSIPLILKTEIQLIKKKIIIQADLTIRLIMIPQI